MDKDLLRQCMRGMLKVHRERKPDEAYDAEELAAGVMVEKEHTGNPEVAKAIAKDHLNEDPKYYTHLLQMEIEHTDEDDEIRDIARRAGLEL